MTSKVKRLLLLALLATPLVVLVFVGLIFIAHYGRIYPGISVAGLNVSGQNKTQALAQLKSINASSELELIYPEKANQKFIISLTEIEFRYDLEKSVEEAYLIGRSGSFLNDLSAIAVVSRERINLPLKIAYNDNKLNEYLSVVAGQVSDEPVYPKAYLENETITVEKGMAGHELDQNELKNAILSRLALANFSPIQITTQKVNPEITDDEANTLRLRAEKLLNKSLVVKHEYSQLNASSDILISFLTSPSDFNQNKIVNFIDKFRAEIERPAQNPTFVFVEEGDSQGKVQEFTPAKAGIEIDTGAAIKQIEEAIKKLENEEVDELAIDIAVKETPPDYQTEEVNNLGINELIGRGESTFKGSISSRIYNVNLAATRVNGSLIAPNEVFSFNAALGDVSKLTGYKEAYVIKDGKTVLGDGGGVCQVSTTLFRAALDAGLPIVERRAHSYRVGYYEQGFPPGLDATVYSPTTDLKFKNDTPGHILIQAYPDTENLSLVFELYGTKDGRTATTTKPVITSSIPPGEDVYVDDPTLPTGQVKQIEHKAWGAKVQFEYKVQKDGEIVYEKTFYSNYKPWQAVFLRGTGPAQQ